MSYHKQEAYCTVQNPWSGFKDLGFLAVGLRPRLRLSDFGACGIGFGVGRVSGLEV